MNNTKKKILVVDDDDVHLYTTRELLEDERCEVVTHKTGFGVTNLVRMIRPDLVLLDVNMPGLSGDNLAALLRKNAETRETKIIFYSSNDEASLRESAVGHGATDYICKGDINGLRKKVGAHLGILENSRERPTVSAAFRSETRNPVTQN